MPSPDLYIAIPAKPLELAKSRLGSALDPEERATLTEKLVRRCVQAACGVVPPDHVLVVTADAEVAAVARESGVHIVPEERPGGVNQAVALAVRRLPRGAALLVLHSDLPGISAADVQALARASRALGHGSVVMAPDRVNAGTNALLLWPATAIEPRFEGESFRAHLAAAHSARLPTAIVRRPALASDLDHPEDLGLLTDELHEG
jgi:2-phospho-L-lactate guanylyltransferase